MQLQWILDKLSLTVWNRHVAQSITQDGAFVNAQVHYSFHTRKLVDWMSLTSWQACCWRHRPVECNSVTQSEVPGRCVVCHLVGLCSFNPRECQNRHKLECLVTSQGYTILYVSACYYNYWLTPCSRVLLGKLTVSQLVKKFPAFHGTRRFITAITNACHLSLSWARSTQFMPPNPLPKVPS